MARCCAPPGDRDHAPTCVKLAKRAGGWLAAVLPPAPSTESLCVTHDVPEPSTESLLGVTHDVTHNSMAVGNDTRPKMNRKMLFFHFSRKVPLQSPKVPFHGHGFCLIFDTQAKTDSKDEVGIMMPVVPGTF